MSEVHHVKKLKNANFHNVYLHLFRGMQVLITDQIYVCFCLFEMAWGIGCLLLHTSRQGSRHQTSGYYSLGLYNKAVGYTRPTRFYALNPSDTFDIAMHMITRLALRCIFQWYTFLNAYFQSY